ncbi:MAG: insulinase family protein [Candidatus Fermentibacteraceae bacterium]
MRELALLALLTAAALAGPVTEMELSNGIRVISRKLETGSVEGVSLFIEGGSRALDEETQGLEAFALESALMGGGEYTGPVLRQVTDTTLAEVTGTYNYDYSRIHVRCLAGDLPLLLDVLSQCLSEPEMESDAVEKVRQSMLADLAEAEVDPDRAVWHVCNRAFLDRHPYILKPDGVPGTVQSFSSAEAADFLRERLRAGNLLITHAGSTPDSLLLPLLEEAFGSLPRGGGGLPEAPPFRLRSDTLVTEEREVQTAYAVVKFEAPPAGHPDRPAFMAGMNALSEVLWDVLRTESNLTYATYAGATFYPRNWGYMYVSSPLPQEACSLMASVYRETAAEGFDPDLLRGSIETYRTGRGMRRASRDMQCWLLGVGEVSGDGWRRTYYLVDSLAALEPADVRQALLDWSGPCAWGVIASGEQLEDLEGPWPVR